MKTELQNDKTIEHCFYWIIRFKVMAEKRKRESQKVLDFGSLSQTEPLRGTKRRIEKFNNEFKEEKHIWVLCLYLWALP